MEYDSLITKIKVLIISILLTSVIILSYFIDQESSWEINKIISCIVSSIFTFFFSPMVKYIINWLKTVSLEEAVYAGYKIGYHGMGLLLVIDPVVGTMYYFNKRFKKKNNGNMKMIIVGWYIV